MRASLQIFIAVREHSEYVNKADCSLQASLQIFIAVREYSEYANKAYHSLQASLQILVRNRKRKVLEKIKKVVIIK